MPTLRNSRRAALLAVSALAPLAGTSCREGRMPDGPGRGPSRAGAAPVVAAGVRWVGRVDVRDPRAIAFAWSASGFVGDFEGPTVAAKLKTVGGGDIFFQPVVDGKPGPRFSVAAAEQTVTLASGLGAGPHRVELYRESEGKGFGYSVFSGFAAGTPRPAPPGSGRLIEVIGDSISAGYGNLGEEAHPDFGPDPRGGCPFTSETESAYRTYGAMAARAVGADVSILAASGWGIYSDHAGNTEHVVPSLFENTLGDRAEPRWRFAIQPQAVVINLGTNDARAKNLTADRFKPAYAQFLFTIRERYPDALVLCTVGPLLPAEDRRVALQYLQEVVDERAARGDAKVKLLDFGMQDASKGTGCDWHPNVRENERLARLLEAELSSSLGWYR